MRGYDSWLERPYQQAAEFDDAFLAFCERDDLDPDDDASLAAFENDLDAAAEDAEFARLEAAGHGDRI